MSAMARFSNNIQSYKIGDPVKDNLMNCELKFEDSTATMEASALKYQDFKDAETLYNILCEINSPWLTKPHGLRKGENQTEGFVFVEKITPFSVWLENEDKLDMWKIYGNNGNCIGIGDDFKKKFKQILSGLEAIHNSNKRHGCLSGGVYLGKDDNIRLSNFLFFDVTVDTLKEDFEEFQKLVRKAISLHDPPGGPVQIREVQEFNKLFTHILGNFREVNAFWLYKTPFLWDSSQKAHFFDKLNNAFQIKPILTRSLFNPSICRGGWRTNVRHNSPLNKVLNHFVYDQTSKVYKMNDWYGYESGIVVLIRNFNHHRFIFVDPFNEVELDFPGITGIIYFELVNGGYRQYSLVCGVPPNYQFKQLVDHKIPHVSGVSQQSTIKNTKIVMEYIKEEMMSIW